jgi:hypothetical protein
LILRNYQELPFYTENDIDILIVDEQLALALSCVERLCMINSMKYKVVSNKFGITSLLLEFKETSVVIDFITLLVKQWVPYMDVSAVLASKKSYKNFYIPSKTHELYIILVKELLTYNLVRSKYVIFFKESLPVVNIEELDDLLGEYFTLKSKKTLLHVLKNYSVDGHHILHKKLQLTRLLSNYFLPSDFISWFYLNRIK